MCQCLCEVLELRNNSFFGIVMLRNSLIKERLNPYDDRVVLCFYKKTISNRGIFLRTVPFLHWIEGKNLNYFSVMLFYNRYNKL